MPQLEDEKRLISSFVAADVDFPEEALLRVTRERYIALVSGALAVAVDRGLPPDADVPSYVKQLGARLAETGSAVDPEAVEAVIRWIRGEQNLPDSLPPNHILSLSILLTCALVSERNPTPTEVAAFCAEAIDRADSFQN